MKEIQLHTEIRASRLLIGESLRNAGSYLPDGKIVIITDENVRKCHGSDFPDGMVITLKPGESSKTLDVVHGIYGRMIQNEIDRDSFVLGIGGGVVCDIAGFVASTFLRGLSFGFVATTLLAQVDASIGGKNGVNYEGYKNMVGIIRQPDFVICDPHLLRTLDPAEYREGFAEVVKYAAISDDALFRFLEKSYKAALRMDPEVLERIIIDCVRVKSGIVERDEKESGERRKLNFGHTFGHAFEKHTGIPHGKAVSIGMVLAAGMAVRLEMISRGDAGRLQELLVRFGLPTDPPDMEDEIFNIIKKDKKRGGNQIRMVLLDRIGNAVIKDIAMDNLKSWIHDLC